MLCSAYVSNNYSIGAAAIIQSLGIPKLLGSSSFSKLVDLNSPILLQLAYMAILSSRYNIDISSLSTFASQLIANNMGTCSFISADRTTVVTKYISEPLLTESATTLMWGEIDQTINSSTRIHIFEHLHQFLASGVVESGYRGELIGRIVLLLGRDLACIKKFK